MNDENQGFFGSAAPRHDDEGGLHAPPHLHGWRKAWWWFDFVILVKLARLRFVGILALIGVTITQWDTLKAYYDKWTRQVTANEVSRSDIEYFCPMHPTVIRDNPRDKCPICFMPLSKRKKGETSLDVLPAGVVNRVQLSPYRIVLAGIQTWPVQFLAVTKEITAVGYVEFNERGQRVVSARVSGRIDQVFANETGMMVQTGDELLLLYSPELLVTVQNLRDALKNGKRDLLAGAKTRLELLGIDDAQIERLLTASEAETHLRIHSPISGHIITKYVREGQYVQEGTPLYDIADLSSVWVQAQIYEDDVAFLPTEYTHGARPMDSAGLSVTATTRALPDQHLSGKLAFIYPHVDQETRTVTVRFELDNPGHQLRPGSTATVTLKVPPQNVAVLSRAGGDARRIEMLAQGRVLAVPESAVIETGSQQVIYREASPGVYEGVDVQLGPSMSGPDGEIVYPILRGLDEGDLVVVSGSFLVDAETRLNPAAGSIYFGGTGGSRTDPPKVTHVRPSTPKDPNAEVRSVLAKLSPADRIQAETQQFCPVLSDNRLGSMGMPFKVVLDGQSVFLCCRGCEKEAIAHPQETLAKVKQLIDAATSGAAQP